MIKFSMYAFAPLGTLAGTALISIAVSIWINFSTRGAAQREAPRQNAEILYFPAPKPRRRPFHDASPQSSMRMPAIAARRLVDLRAPSPQSHSLS
jgi:hypothetical protein